MPDDLGAQIRDYVDTISSPAKLEDVTRRRRPARSKRAVVVVSTVVIVAGALSIAIVNSYHTRRLVVAPTTNREPHGTPSRAPLHATAVDAPPLVSPSVVIQSDTSIYTLTYSDVSVNPLARYDTQHNRVAATTSVSRAQDIALGPNELFVLRSPPVDVGARPNFGVATSAEVEVLSPDSLHVERTFPIATKSPLRITLVGGVAWVMGFDGVERYNAATGQPLGPVDLHAENCPSLGSSRSTLCAPLTKVSPYDMTADPTTHRIFVAWEDNSQSIGVTEFETNGTPVGQGFPLGRSKIRAMTAARALASGESSLFVESDGANTSEWRLYKTRNLFAPSAIIGGSTALKLRRSGLDVWAIDQVRSSVACLDPRTGQTLWKTSVDNPVEVAAINRELLVFTATTVERAAIPTACESP